MKFSYRAKKNPKDIIDGIIDAENWNQAAMRISAMGLIPFEILEFRQQVSRRKGVFATPLISIPSLFFQKSHWKERVFLTRQMSDLISSSVPILKSLEIVIKQTREGNLKKHLQDVHDAMLCGVHL